MSTRAFRPFPGGAAQIIAVTANANERTALNLPSAQGGYDLLFYNAGSSTVYLRAGSATDSATSTNYTMIVPPGALISYGVHGGTHLAHRGDAATTLHVLAGEGV